MPGKPKTSGGGAGKKEDEVDKNRRIIRKYIKHYEQLCSDASMNATDSQQHASTTTTTNTTTNTLSSTTNTSNMASTTFSPYQPLVTKLAKLAKSEDGPPLDLSSIPLIITPPPLFTLQDLSLFLQSLTMYPHYSHLSFLRTNFSDSGTIVLAQFLKPNPLITKLELIDNHIGPLGSKHLSRALQHNETLKSLNLDFNPIGDEGCSLLSVGIAWNSSLKELSLQYCQIGSVGIMSFAEEVIVKNQSLTSVDLTGNQIGCDGIIYIGRSLPNANPNLKSLNLSGTCSFRDHGDLGYFALDKLANGIEEQGMETIREVLQKQSVEEEEQARLDREKQEARDRGEYVAATSREQKKRPPKQKSVESLLGEQYLTDVNLRLNRMDERGAERMLELLKKRKTITKLTLYEQIDPTICQKIIEQMLSNREKAIKRAKLLARQRKKKKKSKKTDGKKNAK